MEDDTQGERVGGLDARNFCVSFIDILGQRDAMRGQGVLPVLRNENEKREFLSVVESSIGSIHWVQSHAEEMVKPLIASRSDSPVRAALPEAQRATWDEMQATRISTQRWSDGIVSYVSLGNDDIKCPLNGLYGLIGVAGTHVLLGLVKGLPIRGAIELAWGAELRPGELYGPAIARAYELENSVADYPRIVMGPNVIEYLRIHARNQEQDPFSQYDTAMANLCLELLAEDEDGNLFVDYLGDPFRQSVTRDLHHELYDKANRFVRKEWERFRSENNSKLAFRYARLAEYFSVRGESSW